jgi:hypothetical protein
MFGCLHDFGYQTPVSQSAIGEPGPVQILFGCLHGIEYGCPEIRLGVITTWFHQTGDTWTNQLEIDVILPKHSVA